MKYDSRKIVVSGGIFDGGHQALRELRLVAQHEPLVRMLLNQSLTRLVAWISGDLSTVIASCERRGELTRLPHVITVRIGALPKRDTLLVSSGTVSISGACCTAISGAPS